MTRTDELYADAGLLVRVHRLTRDLAQQDQEDIAQEAVANYLGAFATGQAPDNAAAWLEVAVRNEASDFLRQRRRQREHEMSAAADGSDGDVEDALVLLRTFVTPSLVPVRADLLGRVLGLLPPEAAEVLRLRFVEDLDAASVAARLGIGRAAVDQRVARAKRSLRDMLVARPDLADELRRAHPRLYSSTPSSSSSTPIRTRTRITANLRALASHCEALSYLPYECSATTMTGTQVEPRFTWSEGCRRPPTRISLGQIRL